MAFYRLLFVLFASISRLIFFLPVFVKTGVTSDEQAVSSKQSYSLQNHETSQTSDTRSPYLEDYSEQIPQQSFIYLLVVHDSDDSSLDNVLSTIENEVSPPKTVLFKNRKSWPTECINFNNSAADMCFQYYVPRIKIESVRVQRSVTENLIEVENRIKAKPVFVIILASDLLSVCVTIATIAGQYRIPVIDAGFKNRRRYFTLEDVQLYFHLGEDYTRSKEMGALVNVMDTLRIRTMGVVYEKSPPFNVIYEDFVTSVMMKIRDCSSKGSTNCFEVTSEFNLTMNSDKDLVDTCKSLLLSDQTTLVVIGSCDFQKKVYAGCREYIEKQRPALISSSDLMEADYDSIKSLPDGILMLKPANESLMKRLRDSAFVAQISLYYVHDVAMQKTTIPSSNSIDFEEVLRVKANQPHPGKERVQHLIENCLKQRISNSICAENIPHTFLVQNLYTSKEDSVDGVAKKRWFNKGVVKDDSVYINSIKWTGNFFRNMRNSHTKPELRITIATIEPFLIWREPNVDKSCDFGQVCYPYLRGPMDNINDRVDDIVLNFTVSEHEVKCCDGLEVELIDRLSRDMEFNYILFFGNFPAGLMTKRSEPSKQAGTDHFDEKEDVKWLGLVGSVFHGQADLAIGSISITNERSQYIRFTAPYFYSGFAIMVAKKPPEPEKFAFLKPMDWKVWVTILLCCKGVAFIIAHSEHVIEKASQKQAREMRSMNTFVMYNERNRLLNPHPHMHAQKKLDDYERANKQESKYWFGTSSSLNSVYALLFLHTLPTKMPQGTTARIITYIWAGISLLLVSCYTGNLASFMAGRLTYLDLDITKIINSPNALSYGAVKGSSVQKYITEQWAYMEPTLRKNSVSSASDAIQRLKNATMDAYFDDAPIVYWEVATDPDCKLVPVGNTFGDDYYGIVVSNELYSNPLFLTLNEYINRYRDNFYLDHLREKWLEGSRTCPPGGQIQGSLGLSHLAGLFLVLIGFSLFCSLLVFVEIIIAKVVQKLAMSHHPPDWLSNHSLQLYGMWRKMRLEVIKKQKKPVDHSPHLFDNGFQRGFINHHAGESSRRFSGQLFQKEKPCRTDEVVRYEINV